MNAFPSELVYVVIHATASDLGSDAEGRAAQAFLYVDLVLWHRTLLYLTFSSFDGHQLCFQPRALADPRLLLARRLGWGAGVSFHGPRLAPLFSKSRVNHVIHSLPYWFSFLSASSRDPLTPLFFALTSSVPYM